MTTAEIKTALQGLAVELENPEVTDVRRSEIGLEIHRYETLLRAIEAQISADMISIREQELAISQAAIAKAQALQAAN